MHYIDHYIKPDFIINSNWFMNYYLEDFKFYEKKKYANYQAKVQFIEK